MMRAGGIAALILLGCQEFAGAVTVELTPPPEGCFGENVPAPAACDVPGGERGRADKGTFELAPAEEENSTSPAGQAPIGAYLPASEVPLPEPAPAADAESLPRSHVPVTVRIAGEIGEPIAITVCLAGLAMGTGRKKSRATPGRRHAA
ncbi:MAG: hypothetical protein ACLQVN_08230 [Bryobacteraceae bacterium]